MSSFKLSEKGRSIIAKTAIHNKSKPYCSMLQVPCVAYGLGKESDLVQYIGNDSRTLVLLELQTAFSVREGEQIFFMLRTPS